MDEQGQIAVRQETADDQRAIRLIHELAFGQAAEADLVDALRADGEVLLSLVAERDNLAVGHILFSRMSIETSDGSIPAVALAPVAVLPGCQRLGIGARLIRHGIALLRQRGERIVLVLGHPRYYWRFGFAAEKARTLDSPFPPEAFMALELAPLALNNVRGRVKYPPAFGI